MTRVHDRLSKLEEAALPRPVAVYWKCRKAKHVVLEDGRKMTLKSFQAAYPGGVLITVTRKDYRPLGSEENTNG